MPLKLVLGRAKSGKSKYIYDEIKRHCDLGDEVMLIVPEQYTHAAEKKLLSIVGAITDNRVEVFSFARLAAITEKRMGIPHTEKIGAVGKALTVANIIRSRELSFFKSISAQNGFLDVLTSTISEFKKYLIFPETLAEAARKTKDEVLAMKLGDLSVIYGDYENAVSSKYTDSGDALTIFAEHLAKSDIYKNKYIFLDEFSTFVPQETAVIRELERQAREVCAALCCDEKEKNPTLFMPTADTADTLKKNVSGKVSVVKTEGTHFNSADMEYIEENLYRFPANKRRAACKDVSVLCADNPCAETEAAAIGILSLVRDSGYRFGEIGVICSDTASYERHIERIFALYKIPYFIDTKKDVLGHHIIRFILSLIEVYTDDYSYESIFNYLKASFVDADPKHICLLENFILRSRPRRASWLDDDKWNSLAGAYFKDDEYSAKIINNIRKRYILPLADMHEKIKGRRTVRNDAQALYALMTDLHLPETISRCIEDFRARGELSGAKEYEQIWDIIITSLDEIVAASGDLKTSPADFLNILNIAFSQHQIGNIPSTVDRVIVGNTERTRADGLKALFVLGANEGVFPVAPKNDGVLTDRDKELLGECSVEFSTTSEIAVYYSQFAVYTAFTMPSDKLFVSYSKADNSFKTMRKSYIVTRLCALLGISEKSAENFLPEASRCIASPDVCREYLCENAARFAAGAETDSIWKNVYNYYRENTDFIPRLEKFRDSDNIAHRLNRKNIEKLTGMMTHTSISKIQRYTACRYSYFMDYILNIRPPKEEVVDRLDIGNITHYILEQLMKKINASGAAFSEVDDSFVQTETDAMLSEFMREASSYTDDFGEREQYIIKRLRNSIVLCFNAIKKHITESKFEPMGYEMEFNDNSDLGCIEIKTADGRTVSLTGKIDRADAYKTKDGTFIRVVDYKTGSKTFKLDDIFYGLDVQLVVYLNALVSSNPDYKHGGALYFLIDDPFVSAKSRISDSQIAEKLDSALRLKGMIVKDETAAAGYDEKTAAIRNKYEPDRFALMDSYLKKLLGKICTEMADGDISINPCRKGAFSPCTYCKYTSVCRFEPTDRKNSYNHLEPITNAEDIWKRMEAELNVDEKPADGN